MNHVHRILWNAVKGCYIVTNEVSSTAQSRGKAAALLVAMAVSLSANAATVSEGVLTTEDNKPVVMIHNNLVNDDGSYQGLEFSGFTNENVSGLAGDVRISSVAEAVTNVFVGHDRTLTISGDNVDIKANLFSVVDLGGKTQGYIRIGSKADAKTTGSFGTISVGLPGLDSVTGQVPVQSYEPGLLIENSEISIDTLRTSLATTIESDASVSINTWQAEAMGNVAMFEGPDNYYPFTNRGNLTIEKIETGLNNVDHFTSPGSVLVNEGTVHIGTAENAHFGLHNEEGATASIDKLVIHMGDTTNDAAGITYEDSYNRGTMTVADRFVVNGAGAWGNNAAIFGVFRNYGDLTVGTQEKNASEITVNGQMFNDGTDAVATLYGNVTVADMDTEDASETIFSNTNGATINISGNLEVDSGTFINENATLTVGGMFGAAGNIDNKGTIRTSDAGQQLYITGTFTNATENASIEDFYVVVAGDSTLNLAAGTADLTELSISNGTAYVGEGVTAETVNLGDVDVWSGRSLHVAGGATTGNLTVGEKAVIDEAIYGSEETGTGKLVVTGTVTNQGQIRLNELDAASYTDMAEATATLNKLTLASGTVVGSLNANELTLGDGSKAAQLTIVGTAEENDRGNVRVGNSAYIAKNASVVIGGKDDTTASLKVVGASGTEAIDGILTIAGTLEAAKNGTLYAEGLTLDGGALGVTASSAQTDYLSATAAGGTVNLSQGGKLTVAGGSTAGITFNFNGVETEVRFAKEGQFFENATINLNGKSWQITGESGDGFGENTVNINDGSNVSYTDNAVLKNNTTLTINEGGRVEAGQIAFEDRYSGGLTLAGGTLATTLDQVFTEVNADEYIEGTDVSTGETVQIPVSGIQSVGSVKDELTGANGIVYESGIFEFTDDGWTTNAVNSASSQLQNAFENFTGAEGTLVFSGTPDSESGTFTVADANELNSNIVLSGTILDAAGDVTFGNAVEGGNVVTVETTGFQAIANADKVTVSDGHHLYLVGFEGDKGTAELLTTAENGTINVNDATLTLGLDGKLTGGHLAVVNNNGTLNVAAGGTFVIDSVTGDDSAINVREDATLTVGKLEGSSSIVNNGTLELNADNTGATNDAAITNTGFLTDHSAGLTGEIANSGTLTANAFSGTLTNTGNGVVNVVSSAVTSELVNRDNAQVIASGVLELGKITNEQNALIKAQNVLIADSAASSNAGTVETTGNIVLGAASEGVFDNTGTLAASANMIINASVENSGRVEVQNGALLVGNGNEVDSFVNAEHGSITAASVLIGNLYSVRTFRNEGQITAGDYGVTLTDVADASNNGTITTTSMTITNSSLVNTGTIEATSTIEVADNASFTNKAEGTVTVDKLDVKGTFANEGKLDAQSITVTADATLTQTDAGTISTQDFTVVGSTFDLGSGTWIISSDTGISFVNEEGAPVDATVNVTSGKELVTANADVDNITYNVTKTLTFGTTAGIADNLGIENVNGILTVDKGVEIGATGSIQVGSADVAGTTRTPGAAFTAAAGSVTIFTGNAFGADGSEAGILAGDDGLSAVIDQDAKAVLTGIQHSGTYKLLEGFDLSANLDAETGEWIGGWTGENGQYVTVDNGSDLNWKVDVAYDKDGNAIIVDTVAADVRSVYNFATPDIANAALASGADASKGADIAFMQAVINNKDLNVAQTERIVNSVTQIAASLGTAANFLNDASALMNSVESRTGLLSDAGNEAGLWVRVEGGKYKMDGLEIAGGQDAGYDTNTYGVTFGADGLVQPNLRIGAAFSYLNGSADADGDVLSGTNEYDTYGLQAYAAYDVSETMRISGEIGWFHSSAELSQKISFADVRKAEADVDTDAFTFGIRGDWRFDVNGFAVVPHVGLRGIYMMNDDFTTEIDGKKAFENDQDNTFTVQIPVGVTVEKAFVSASGWNVVPSADFTLAPQFGDTEYDTTVTGVGTGVSQAVTADMAGDILGRVSFGVKADNGTSSFGAYYGFTAGDAGRQDHAFNLSFSYRF